MRRCIILAMLRAPVGGNSRHKCYRRAVNLGLIPDLRQRQPPLPPFSYRPSLSLSFSNPSGLFPLNNTGWDDRTDWPCLGGKGHATRKKTSESGLGPDLGLKCIPNECPPTSPAGAGAGASMLGGGRPGKILKTPNVQLEASGVGNG
ncbi:hypothetical protein ALC57_17142 [Trachymyrmex cornetzi]|uniref:Uncharacterized protein n=1 Tax=Trachymyrmex cornetzi TaxID=471704 RepID=A0A195DCH5_9HYME|nr:hypothetical protein ALC57_17142 [Trachymyrmex cornetzi]